jgi:hypothetical protein
MHAHKIDDHNHLVPGSVNERAQAKYIGQNQLVWMTTLESGAQLLPFRRRHLCTFPWRHAAAGLRFRCKRRRYPESGGIGKDCPFWIYAFEDATGDERVHVYKNGNN